MVGSIKFTHSSMSGNVHFQTPQWSFGCRGHRHQAMWPVVGCNVAQSASNGLAPRFFFFLFLFFFFLWSSLEGTMARTPNRARSRGFEARWLRSSTTWWKMARREGHVRRMLRAHWSEGPAVGGCGHRELTDLGVKRASSPENP